MRAAIGKQAWLTPDCSSFNQLPDAEQRGVQRHRAVQSCRLTSQWRASTGPDTQAPSDLRLRTRQPFGFASNPALPRDSV